MRLTQERLKELFNYDKNTGVFTRKKNRGPNGKKGMVCGCLAANGYLVTMVDYVLYYNHRLAWLYIYGNPLPKYLDHINGNKIDNIISNLRSVNMSQNGMNRKIGTSITGELGIYTQNGKYRVKIGKSGKQFHIGYFVKFKDALRARVFSERKFFGKFARINHN